MADRRIDIELRARNAMARGLASAGRALRTFGRSLRSIGRAALNVGRTITRAFLGATAAIVAFSVKALHAHAQQESAERSLIETARLYGDEIDGLLPKMRALAGAIQNETGVADELTLARMASLRSLGIEIDMLDDAARGVVALEKAGMGGAMAVRALAMAHKGDFQQLQRYIPTLRLATTQAEKAAAVNEFLAKQYAVTQRELNTVAGQWGLLRGRVGDALEEIGRAISKSSALTGLMQRAGDAVQRFGERIRAWVDSERFERVQQAVSGIIEAIASGPEERRELWGAVAEIIKSGFVLGAEEAVEILKNAMPGLGELYAKSVKAGMKFFAPGAQARRTMGAARRLLGIGGEQEEAAASPRLQQARERHEQAMVGFQALTASYAKIALENETERLRKQKERNDAARDEIRIAQAGMRERLNLTERMQQKERDAAMTVRQYIEALRSERREEIIWQRQQARAQALRDRKAGGAELTQAEKDLITAVDRIALARETMARRVEIEETLLHVNESQLAAIDTQGRTLVQLLESVNQLPPRIATIMESKE